MDRREFLAGVGALLGLAALPAGFVRLAGADRRKRETLPETGPLRLYSAAAGGYVMASKVMKPEEEWKRALSPEQFRVTREKGTERAFTGKYWNHHAKGTYRCVCCGNDLYRSDAKYDSGTGWPSFTAPIAPENVRTREDRGWITTRTEVVCARCDAHLGHVFDDGPEPTGLRYCMNSAALDFVPEKP